MHNKKLINANCVSLFLAITQRIYQNALIPMSRIKSYHVKKVFFGPLKRKLEREKTAQKKQQVKCFRRCTR